MRAVGAWLAVLLASCGTSPARSAPGSATEVPGFRPDEVRALLRLSPLPPPPPDPTNAFADDPRAARLGQFLFFDTRFSRDGSVGCVTCHDPAKSWADGRRLARGLGDLERHTMTLWNVAQQRWFFWDGRADSLWSQALQPFENPAEHGTSRVRVLHQVAADPELRGAYEAVFGALPALEDAARFPPSARPVPGDPADPDARAWAAMGADDRRDANRAFANLGKAIAAFERRIASVDSPFDRFVAAVRSGAPVAAEGVPGFGPQEQEGLRLFLGKARCVLCHSGPAFSDLEFHDNRTPRRDGAERVDPGRFEGIPLVQEDPFGGLGEYSDASGEAREGVRDTVGYLLREASTRSTFKTPSLRNVALTAPYMHRGQLDDLAAVIEHYDTLRDAPPSHYQGERILAPLGLTASEREALHRFLVALTDDALDPGLTTKPTSPR